MFIGATYLIAAADFQRVLKTRGICPWI